MPPPRTVPVTLDNDFGRAAVNPDTDPSDTSLTMAVTWAVDATGGAAPGDAGSPHSEDDLVARLREGRTDAFELLFVRYRTPVYNLAARLLRDAEEAKDAAQETFVKALQQLPRQDGDCRLKPWLYRVTVNICLDRLRSRRRHPTCSLAEDVEHASPTDEFAQAETARLVDEALRQLSERHRAVLVLKDLHGLTHDEIAAVLGISRGAAETLLFRARESFRSIFEKLSPSIGDPASCAYARGVALALVGRNVSPQRRRELAEHVKVCPACRRSLDLRTGVAFGLALFLHRLTPPQTLAAPMLAAKTVIVTAAAAGVTLAGGAVAYEELHSPPTPHHVAVASRPATPWIAARGSGGPTGAADTAKAVAGRSHSRPHGRAQALGRRKDEGRDSSRATARGKAGTHHRQSADKSVRRASGSAGKARGAKAATDPGTTKTRGAPKVGTKDTSRAEPKHAGPGKDAASRSSQTSSGDSDRR
jgi:RNA polymerase sigma-70 factor (ECF subfamily)